MAFWWVNHKQTVREEISGGYIWSPKRRRNGSPNETYENLAKVEPGDLIFSYANRVIAQIGVATDSGTTSPKPEEFGTKGSNCDVEGWIVPVEWHRLEVPIVPADHLDVIAALLPPKHSPIGMNGKGRQNVYLAALSDALGEALLSLTPQSQEVLVASAESGIENPLVDTAENAIQREIENDTSIDSTERQELVKARRGQGRFRRNIHAFEQVCRITGVSDIRLLRASHIKPWRLCENNHERLDGNNGLLLTPTFDLLFDRGYLSFRDDGSVVLSEAVPADQLAKAGYRPDAMTAAPFNEAQRRYLAFHRTMFGFDMA